ncbi:MAG: HDOD domain-containing protein, partial [Armatimonadetes bacterium]|nr:HDOD domain-containing protein [Armatimonadota bacterium]
RLWRHSIYCAKLCQVLGEALGRLVGEAFTVGLLHDVGKILLCHYNHKAFALALHNYTYEKGKIAHWESEDRVLGINHALVGFFAGENWKLPPLVREAISNHHSPLLGESPRDDGQSLTQMVHLSDLLCNIMGYSSVPIFQDPEATAPLRRVDERLYSFLSLSREDMEAALDNFQRRKGEAEAFFPLMEGG